MIVLTPDALTHVRKLMLQNDFEGYALRVEISPGGCSGYSYVLDLVEDEVEEGDHTFEQEGLKILCDPKSFLIVDGLCIDYQSDLMSGGFRFDNPNARKSCGCGTSFAC